METLIWVFTAILYSATYEDFFRTFLESKKRKGYAVWIGWGLYTLYQCTVMRYVHGSAMNIIFNSLALLCIVGFLYKGRISTKILAIIVSSVLNCAAEVLVAFFALMIDGEIVATQQIYVVMSKILFWALVRISVLLIKGKVEEKHKKIYSIILAVVLVSNLFIEVLLVEVNKVVKFKSVYLWSVFFSLFMLMLDIICFKIFIQLIDRQKIKRENEFFARQLDICDIQMQERMAMLEETRRTRHDMKNQIMYIQSLLMNEQIEKAQEFLNELMETKLNSQTEIAKSGNLIVDSILNNKYAVAKSKNISMSVDLRIQPALQYKASDLCIVIGNLVENALEAAEKVEDKREINIQMREVHKKLFLKIQNTYNGTCKKMADGLLETTKANALNHGIGLSSVRKIVNRNNGIMNIDMENGWFCISIYM
ncbi:MAG: GHKL domain-containing protein [Lachnospiraceae bacterium]|nr:GHKL domain-containing protein [Lachnospiraceae bacterium]